MAKELIISANVHEKKVALLEDGVVTEFYVERRDENQGVVGNLYKGRVMKVLPGMQSAFVDIGLERDAFLYVSDFTEFMEEEDEIDFREAAAEQKPQRPDDRGRRDRQQQPPHRESSRLPAREALTPAERAEVMRIDDAVEHVAEIAVESVIPPPPPDELPVEPLVPTGEADAAKVAEYNVERVTDDVDQPLELIGEAFETVAGFEEEEVAAPVAEETAPPRGRRGRTKKTPDEKTKPARKTTTRKPVGRGRKAAVEQEATAEHEKSAVEPEPEAPNAEIPRFERIVDEDAGADAGEFLKDAIVQERIIEEIHEAEYKTSPVRAEPEPEWRVGSFRSPLDASGFQRIVDESGDDRPLNAASLETEPDPEESSASPFRHVSDYMSSFYNRLRSRSSSENAESEAPEIGVPESEDVVEASASDIEEDREAEIRDRGPRAEFAIRRGGRGRRGRRRPDSKPANQAASAETNGGEPAAEVETTVEAAPAEATSNGETAAAAEGNGGEKKPAATRSGPGRQRPDRRNEQQRRGDQSRSRRPERQAPPTISDLLHEGQEVLVQIAKEPIAKKGARITSHIALPGRYLVYMPTVNHVGVSRKIPNEVERVRLKRTVAALRDREGAPGGFIARTACAGHTEQELHDDMRYLIRTWTDLRKKTERSKSPALVHRDLDLVQRILRDQLSEEFSAIRIDNDVEYARIVEFVNRVQPKLVKRVKLHVGNAPILEKYGVQPEIDKAVRPRVWLKSGGYIVINQTEALVAIDVNTGKFVGKSDKLEDTITRTNLEAAKEVVRQVRLRDLGGIIVIDFIDMEERKNRQKVMMALQSELSHDRAPSKILSINDFGLVAITRKRVKQSLERTLCSPCPYCQGAGMVKSAQTMCFEILEQAKAFSKQLVGSNDVMLRVSPHVAEALRSHEREVMEEVEAYFGTPVTIEPDPNLHQEQFDFAIV
jgi:ribonuclease G